MLWRGSLFPPGRVVAVKPEVGVLLVYLSIAAVTATYGLALTASHFEARIVASLHEPLCVSESVALRLQQVERQDLDLPVGAIDEPNPRTGMQVLRQAVALPGVERVLPIC